MDSYEGNNADPLSLHKYLYAHGNPVNRIDPSGHEGNTISTTVVIGIILNIGFTAIDAIRLRDAQIRGDPKEIAESSVYLTFDVPLLAIPYSGMTGTFGRGGAVAIETYVQASAGISTRLRGAWTGIRTLALFSQARANGGDFGDTPKSDSSTGRQDGTHSGDRAYDSAREAAMKNAGELGPNTKKMHDPETGTLIGEASNDMRRGWRLDEGHFNFWDWTAGKKGKGGKYGHEFFEGETGPHSKFPGYTEWK